MSVSMKNLDPAFQGVGNKEGLEIWRIENSRPIKLTGQKLHTGCCYVILQTKGLKSGVFHHDVHYWIGKGVSQDEAAIVALKAVELDASLGGRAVQYREVEGGETEKFLSYFQPCFIPHESPTSDITDRDRSQYNVRLFRCRGRHVAQVKEVLFSRSSLNHDEVFVLDTEYKIFQFNGKNSDIYEQARALDLVQYLKDNHHNGACNIAVIEDGKFVPDADTGEFWGFFGGFAPLGRRLDGNDGGGHDLSGPIIYCIQEGEPKKLDVQVLQRELLQTNKSYILDCGSELFTWVGRDTQLQERRSTTLAVEKLIATHKDQLEVHLTCVIEGFEPREFKSKFESWPVITAVPISENGRGKVAALLKHKGFNVKGLLKAAPVKQPSSVFNSSGKLEIWIVNDTIKDSLPSSEHGKFFNSNCYIVLYTYSEDRKDAHIIFSWLGHQSSVETRASTAEYVKDLSSTLEKPVEVRVIEGKEPSNFKQLFLKLFIVKGEDKELGVRLLQVHHSSSQNWQAIEVNLDATSLNSSGCAILQIQNKYFTWYGKFSTVESQEATEDLAQHFLPNASSTILKEGSETELFWETLGGKKVHPSHQEPKDIFKDPRLFSCIYSTGQIKVKEIYSMTQDDLLGDEIMIVDCYSDIFVWVGRAVGSNLRHKAMEIGEKYLDYAARCEGLSLETPIYKVTEGGEPSFFWSLFSSWDTLRPEHLNVFQRKILSLKGQKVEPSRSPKRRSPSHQITGNRSDIFGSIDKSRFGKTSPHRQEQSPEKFVPFKTESSPETLVAKSKFSNGRSPRSRSSSISQLSSMFESQLQADLISSTPKIPRHTRRESFSAIPTPKIVTGQNRRESISATPTPSSTPPRTPRVVASPRSPAIAALASVFEPYSDKKLDFAWPGLKSRSEEKSTRETRETFMVQTPSPTIAEAPSQVVETPTALKNGDSDITWYPYERVKVSSPDPVVGIDTSRRESYLSEQDFQDTFHMDKDTFYKLPKWKQDKYKVLVDLF